MDENIKRAIADWNGSWRMASVVPLSSDPTKNWLVVVWADGWSIPITSDSKYKIRDIDKQTTYAYFWYQASSWAYQIMRKTNATKSFDYAYWASDYATAWTGRETLTYWPVQ